jgi:hypothetical protein
MSWTFDQSISPDGFGLFFIHVWNRANQQPLDVTFFRDVPAIVDQMTFADPFGPATAVLHFSQCTGFDGPWEDPATKVVPSETWWLRENVNVDITWIPASTTQWFSDEQMIVNPLTQQKTLYLHDRQMDGTPQPNTWEGFIVSTEPSYEGVSVQCQGALYQLDRYYAKPLSPMRPRTVEGYMCRYFDRRRRGIWTQDLVIPDLSAADWQILYTQEKYAKAVERGPRYVAVDLTPAATSHWINPNSGSGIKNNRWTGFMTRMSGAWDKALTGYIQGQLSYMYVSPDIPQTTSTVWFAAIYSDLTIVFSVSGELPAIGSDFTVTGLGGEYDGTWTCTNVVGGDVIAAYPTDIGYWSTKATGTMTFAGGTGTARFQRGDQWTITMDPGRIPRMYVRRQQAPVTLVAWYGQPGVETQLTRDGNQAVNVFFGDGKGANPGGDLMWNRMTQPLGTWSLYRPLSTDPDIPIYHYWEEIPGEPAPVPEPWPIKYEGTDLGPHDPVIADLPDGYDAEYERANGVWLSEKMVQFPDGIDEGTAKEIADNWVTVDRDPGWSGNVTLKVDLRDPNGNIRSKWTIRDGDIILLKGFQGTGDEEVRGTNVFHISQVQINPVDGSVSLTIDTKFRDLLSVEEAIARGRDTLVPVKSLQVGKRSAMVDDMIVPWNPAEGSGFIPRSAHKVFFNDAFPHVDVEGNAGSTIDDPPVKAGAQMFTAAYRGHGAGKPIGKKAADDMWLQDETKGVITSKDRPALYIPINAGSTDKSRRWAMVPVLLSQSGTIVRTEIAAYKADGSLAPVEMHVSFYTISSLGIASMPTNPEDSGAPNSALWDGAFEPWDMTTGYYASNIDQRMPAAKMIIGWGNIDQPAGYSPKRKIPGAEGNLPTGLLMDGSPWPYNFFGDEQSVAFPYTEPGYDMKQESTMPSVSVTCAIYVQIPDAIIDQAERGALNWVYIRGRVYRGMAQ